MSTKKSVAVTMVEKQTSDDYISLLNDIVRQIAYSGFASTQYFSMGYLSNQNIEKFKTKLNEDGFDVKEVVIITTDIYGFPFKKEIKHEFKYYEITIKK